MGIIRDIINTKVIGSEVRRGIKKLKEKDTCDSCGKKTEIFAECQYTYWGKLACKPFTKWGNSRSPAGKPSKLCKSCAKKCKKCGKYYCSEHIKDHKCNG